MYVGTATRPSWYLRVCLEVKDLVLIRPTPPGMRAVSDENAVTQSRVELFAQLHFLLGVWEVSHLATIKQSFASKFLPMALDVAIGALFTVEMGEIVIVSETFHRCIPVFVRHARLKK